MNIQQLLSAYYFLNIMQGTVRKQETEELKILVLMWVGAASGRQNSHTQVKHVLGYGGIGGGYCMATSSKEETRTGLQEWRVKSVGCYFRYYNIT